MIDSRRDSRIDRLLGLLAERGRLGVAEAAEALQVSEATVRRDFVELANQQLVTRTHGGVVASSVAYSLPMRYKNGASGNDVKERIAETAASLIRPGQIVGFNGGTTTSATARLLVARRDFAEGSHDEPALTIVTNALNIAAELVLRPHIRTVSIGGVARPKSYEVVGPLAHLLLAELWIDHLILGVDALAADNGASCFHEGEAGVNALMVQRSGEVTVVAGPEKLGRNSFARICDTEAITRVITSTDADRSIVDELEARGVEVVHA